MKKVVSPKQLKEAIIVEAKKLQRKKEIFESIMSFEKELGALNEGGIIGGFGFQADGDMSNQTKTGFVNDFQLSNIARLTDEMKSDEPINEDTLDEIKKLKEELKSLKEENENLKKESK